MIEFPHRPRKRFGQHFLRSPEVLSHILSAVQPTADQHLVEIGPGEGVLTQLLLTDCQQLDVIEIDHDLVATLKQRFKNNTRLVIHDQDVLTFDFTPLSQSGEKIRVIGNLPYQISSPLLFHLFQYLPLIQDMHFMMQKEVVLRLTANVGSKSYGRLSVMSQYFCQNELLFEVDPSAFFPVPKVNSAVIRMIPHQRAVIVQDNNILSQIVKIAFNQRRKTLNNCLKGIINKEKLHKLEIDANLRPEQLSVKDFVNIANSLHQDKREN